MPMGRALAVAFVLLHVATAAAQIEDIRQGVAYVAVRSADAETAARAFRRYRQAASAEAGFVSLDVFEQIGRRGHFVAIDAWRDQAAYDAHQTAASLAQLQEALQPIRTTGYDLRPYKALSIGSVRPATRNAIAVVTHVDIGGGAKIDAPAMMRNLATTSRAEPGCLRFDVTQHAARANHFTIVEVWEDERALDGHAAAAETRRFREQVQPASGSPIDERVFRRIE